MMTQAENLPVFLGLNDKTITDIPKTVEKQRYMVSVAPKAADPGKWVHAPLPRAQFQFCNTRRASAKICP